MNDRERLAAERTNRMLCTTVCGDGLKCAPDWPRCIDARSCAARGTCFWRGWHKIPEDKLRKRELCTVENLDD